MELVCPGGSLASFNAAVDCGADAVYLGYKDNTNARHFAGLNFTEKSAQKALAKARDKNVSVYVALNTYMQTGKAQTWFDAAKRAYDLGATAVIAADVGLLDYCSEFLPNLDLHLSVQGSATNAQALSFYNKQFNVKRAVLPRVLSERQVCDLAKNSDVEIEVFGFGSLCIMAEGRCYLSSYFTGQAPNNSGACSPAQFVRWQKSEDKLQSRLNDVLIDQFDAHEKAGYPTLCKGKFLTGGKLSHILEEPTSLNTLNILPSLSAAGIKAIKIEGRQRNAAYVEKVVPIWRAAIDQIKNNQPFECKEQWLEKLQSVSEGSQVTLGAYSRPWL